MSDDFERSLQEKFWYGACDHEGEFAVHAGRCSVCHPMPGEAVTISTPISSDDASIVTSEMRESGLLVYKAARDDFEHSDIDAIYRAMHALAPVELVSEGERQAVKERDEANVRNAKLSEANIELMKIVERQAIALGDMCNVVASKEARITELKEELVSRPAAFVDPGPEPLKHNPFREFPSDRRRIGG